MEPQRWIIRFYGTKPEFIDHLNSYLAELLDDPALTPASSPLTPASTTSSPIEELPNTRNDIPPESGSGLFVPSPGTYDRLPDQEPGGCSNYNPPRGFEDDDVDATPDVASDEDQGIRSEEISKIGGKMIVDAGGNNKTIGDDEDMEDITTSEDHAEDPKQLEDVHGDETMKDLGDDKGVEGIGSTDNPERFQGVNGVGGDEVPDHSEADESMRENTVAPEDVDEEVIVEDTGADEEASERGAEDTEISGSIREDQEASEDGAEDTGNDGSTREDQEASEEGAEDTGIDGSTREDQETSEDGAEAAGIDESTREDQEASEDGAEDTGIDGSTREDQEASEEGAEDTGIDGSTREDQEASEAGAEDPGIDRFNEEDTEGSGEVNEDTGNAGDQDSIGGEGRTGKEDEELDKAQTKTRKRWSEAANRVIKEGLSIATRSSHIELLAYNHEAIRALLSLEVQGPNPFPLRSLSDGDPLSVAARYLEYSTRLEERVTWYKRVGQFTQVVAVSWCEILRHHGCTNEEVDAMIQQSMGKNFTPRWLKDARRGVKFVHRLIRALREDGWGDTAFEIFFLCGHSLSGYSKLAETPEKSFEFLRERLTRNPPSEPDGWIPYSIPCIINAMTDRSLSLEFICAALGYDYNMSFEEGARRIEKYCEERPIMDAGRDLPSSVLNRDQVLTEFQQSDFTPFFDDEIPPSFNEEFLFSRGS